MTGPGNPDEYTRDLLERVRSVAFAVAVLAGLLAWLVLTLLSKKVITWDDLAIGRG